jgi:hypothetical protein
MTTSATVAGSDAPVADASATGPQAATSSADKAGPPSLGYATPWPKHAWAPSAPAQQLFWRGVRKVVLSGGLGLVVYGAASVASGVNRHAAPVAAAWGVAFVVMMLPAPSRRRRRKKRRRRAVREGGAAEGPASGI